MMRDEAKVPVKDKLFLSATEAAEMVGISLRSMRWYIAHGHLKVTRFPPPSGRKLLLHRTVVDGFAEEMQLMG